MPPKATQLSSADDNGAVVGSKRGRGAALGGGDGPTKGTTVAGNSNAAAANASSAVLTPVMARTVALLRQRRALLEHDIASVDARIFALETQYLDAVAPSRAGAPPCLTTGGGSAPSAAVSLGAQSHLGSLLDGWLPPATSTAAGSSVSSAAAARPLSSPSLVVGNAPMKTESLDGKPEGGRPLLPDDRAAVAVVKSVCTAALNRHPLALRRYTLSSATAFATIERLGLM